MSKKIIFCSGGTGGHIFPAISLMKYFSDKGCNVILVTDVRGDNFLKNYSKFQSYIITADTPLNKNIFKKIYSLINIFFSMIKSIYILYKEKPNLVFGFGGYVSFPIAFVSKIFNIPLVIYDNNVVLGRTNKYLLPFAKKILLATKTSIKFPEKYKKKIFEVGYILREDITNFSSPKKNNDKFFTILVLGGSQGAEIFGKIVPQVIKMIKDKGYKIEINQQCIKSQTDEIIKFYKKNEIKSNVFEFENNILNLILSSDLAISRCGASTTAELVHTHTPFIAVPYPHSMDNHQYLNAKYYENLGCCWLLNQNNFDTTNLFNLIIEIINDEKKLENIRNNMKKNDSKDVYSNVEKQINEFFIK